jgi:hypothetical protein
LMGTRTYASVRVRCDSSLVIHLLIQLDYTKIKYVKSGSSVIVEQKKPEFLLLINLSATSLLLS